MEANMLKRIFKEVEDVNNDFFNLRTVITPDPGDDMTRFTFIMLPNDGAMAHLPLVGAFYIPDAYPGSPPVVHLYTRTGRYNVDVFHSNAQNNNRRASSLCFNILRAEVPGGLSTGTWTPDCTISALFAALMSAIVSLYVPQEYGPDKAEYVSMEALRLVKDNVRRTCEAHKQLLPPVIPRPPLIAAARVRARELAFPASMTTGAHGAETVTAGPIYLQTGDPNATHTFAVDLGELHESIVFSVVLSNRLNDLFGRKKDTILVRNGVTATAARKRAGEPAQWFYHGRPMNDGDMRLHVTVGADQMTMAYYADDGRRYVLGDCPVSRLTAAEIGDVRGVPFWVHIYTKNRSSTPATIYTLDAGGFGYTFRDAEDREFEFVDGADDEEPLQRKQAVQKARDEAGEGCSVDSETKKEESVDVDRLLTMFRAADLSK
ncbi:Ubiquitin-conjugating enzyme [Microdochium nivale]|nr:Ubiquitin-conjugating enzyme [Microdochium nivale]